MATASTTSAGASRPTTRFLILGWVRFLFFLGVFAGILFLTAGRWDLAHYWAYLGIFLAGSAVSFAVVMKTDPSLLLERVKPGPGGKDPHLRIVATGVFVVHWVVAGLDARNRWSEVPGWVLALGLILLACSLALSCWAQSANRFFSSDARVQRDRGHHVVTSGPYRFIRHPGYAAATLMTLASPLALGSYWSALPALLAIPLFLRRLFLEERLLVAELEGYAGYAARVRYRFLPGVW